MSPLRGWADWAALAGQIRRPKEGQTRRGAFASSGYGVPASACLARHRPARWLANPGPRRLKPGLRTRNSRMRPGRGAWVGFQLFSVSLAGVRRGCSAIRCKSVSICVHLCSSVVELLFLGLAAASMKNLRFAPFLLSRLRVNLLIR